MDVLASFALGFVAGVLVVVLLLAAIAIWKVRRIARGFPLAGFHGAARLRPSSTVETDEEDNILVPAE